MIIETDSQQVAFSMKATSFDFSYFQLVIDDCKALLLGLDSIFVNFIRRSANHAAYILAKATNFPPGMQRWDCVSPLFLVSILLFDTPTLN